MNLRLSLVEIVILVVFSAAAGYGVHSSLPEARSQSTVREEPPTASHTRNAGIASGQVLLSSGGNQSRAPNGTEHVQAEQAENPQRQNTNADPTTRWASADNAEWDSELLGSGSDSGYWSEMDPDYEA